MPKSLFGLGSAKSVQLFILVYSIFYDHESGAAESTQITPLLISVLYFYFLFYVHYLRYLARTTRSEPLYALLTTKYKQLGPHINAWKKCNKQKGQSTGQLISLSLSFPRGIAHVVIGEVGQTSVVGL